jgi:class 3 adenylate cyclase
LLTDLSAVIDQLKPRVSLVGDGAGSNLAVAYTVRHPERVNRLVLMNGYARFADVMATSAGAGLVALGQSDPGLFTDTAARTAMGWEGDSAEAWAKMAREACTWGTAVRYWQAAGLQGVDGLLSAVQAPTLVVQNEGLVPQHTVDMARELASGIPDAELLLCGKDEWVIPQIVAFIDGAHSEAADSAEPEPTAGGFRTVLFTDLVGHTAMMSRLGDERGRAVLREHETITRNVLKTYGGTEIKTMGDGFMASFGSVVKAVECAVALQRAMDERNREPGTGNTDALSVRIGLNAGEPIEEDGDLFGATVILASRIAAKAEGGEILVADTVRGLCSGKGFLFADRGEFVAKGFEEPVRLYEVNWRAGAETP